MKRSAAISLTLALSLLLSLLSGCAAGAAEGLNRPVPTEITVPSPAEPVPTPAVSAQPAPEPSPDEERARQAAANRLALELLRAEYEQKDGNVILSPLSIEAALSMASKGASGEAKKALETLGLSTEQGAALSQDDGDSVLSIANSMWFNEKLDGKIDQGFKDVLSSEYGAAEGFFTPNSSGSVDEINGWVKENTRDKIDAIVTKEALSDDALAVLINAIYFGGEWADPFKTAWVHGGKFYADSKKGVDIQTAEVMEGGVNTYFETELATGFAKQYKNGYEFIAVLPKAAGAQGLEEVLTGLDLDEFLESRTWEYDVNIAIPKFELEYANSLKETLTGLGLGSLFEEHALDGMLTGEALELGDTAWVGDVLHKTYIRMYEAGTEAAAATEIEVRYGATSYTEREHREVILDRPFAFLIRDVDSGRVVFCGAVNSMK